MSTISHLIDCGSPPLVESDTAARALCAMVECEAAELPVVDEDGRLAGSVAETRLREAGDPNASVGRFLRPGPVAVATDVHVFDAARVLAAHDLQAVPVVDGEGRYTGQLRRADAFRDLVHLLRADEPGAIVVVELPPGDTSIGKLVHTIEQTEVRLLSVTTKQDEGPSVLATLKLDRSDIARLRHMLEHYGYRVAAFFGEEEDEALLLRVQEFIRFLEV